MFELNTRFVSVVAIWFVFTGDGFAQVHRVQPFATELPGNRVRITNPTREQFRPVRQPKRESARIFADRKGRL